MNKRVCAAILFAGLLLTVFALLVRPGHLSAATRQVTSSADNGSGSLRQTLLDANPGDLITFDPKTFPSDKSVTILLQSALPPLNKNGVILDASDARVVLDGSKTPPGTRGLVIEASNCSVRGLQIRDFKSDGVFVAAGASGNTIGGNRSDGDGPNGQGNLITGNGGSGVALMGNGNIVEGNYIGLDATGRWEASNALNGVAIWGGASNNRVGGVGRAACQTSAGVRAGRCNVISGNGQNGVWIGGANTQGNQVIGNYIGTRADGLGPVGNHYSGVAIHEGSHDNTISDNLISGNRDKGVYLSDVGTSGNQLLGNFIGPDWRGTGLIGQGADGVTLTNGAGGNTIGDATATGRNVIAGNSLDGVRLTGADSANNTVQGNTIGAALGGMAPLPNGQHGVELTEGAHNNLVGGSRLAGEGNLLSGNSNHGVVITDAAHHNTVAGNILGPDATGTAFLANHPYGAIDISNGAHDNIIGGLAAGAGNLISGNPTDGMALFSNDGRPVVATQVLGNLIGVQLDGAGALANHGWGVMVGSGVVNTRIEGNTIAHNDKQGVLIERCEGTSLRSNSIYHNAEPGILSEQLCMPAPIITAIDLSPQAAVIGATEVISGTTIPNAVVEVYSDADQQGKTYEGSTTADATGHFSFTKEGKLAGPNITATASSGASTSEFSEPTIIGWTVLLYINGDNNLQDSFFETFNNLVAAGPSPNANVIVLLDGRARGDPYEEADSALYDITSGELQGPGSLYPCGEGVFCDDINMGSPKTLIDFVNWGRSHAPARHTMLSILDHGGGWAPTSTLVEGAQPRRSHDYLGGNSGLSWDFSSDDEYLDSNRIKGAFDTITAGGQNKLDVVFYDVCLMGMLEVAYQIKDYADFFVSSQNIGWAPVGEQGRYVRTIHGIGPNTTPRQMAQLVVESYAAAAPPAEHPFTISAVDLSEVGKLRGFVDDLGKDLGATLYMPQWKEYWQPYLDQAYRAAQKLDYNADFVIDPVKDSFVDLQDFAEKVKEVYTEPADWIVRRATDVITQMQKTVVAEAHKPGVPWVLTPTMTNTWSFTGVHGLSIFLPLGEDLELDIPITETSPITPGLVMTRNLKLREMYTCLQLSFMCDYAGGSETGWARLINSYYDVAPPPVDTKTGPLGGVLEPDVTPPQTVITVTGTIRKGEAIHITWTSKDPEGGPATGVKGAQVWHLEANGEWKPIEQIEESWQAGTLGEFIVPLKWVCQNSLAVRAEDNSGNLESPNSGANTVKLEIPTCVRLPLLVRGK